MTTHSRPGSASPKALGKMSIIIPLADEETEPQRGLSSRSSDTRANNLSIPTQLMWDQPLPIDLRTSTQLSSSLFQGHLSVITVGLSGSKGRDQSQGIIRKHPPKANPPD